MNDHIQSDGIHYHVEVLLDDGQVLHEDFVSGLPLNRYFVEDYATKHFEKQGKGVISAVCEDKWAGEE